MGQEYLVCLSSGYALRPGYPGKNHKDRLGRQGTVCALSRSPMAGRIDLHWKGRDITIERSTKGRVPMGVFRAYETASGLEIPELTAANCGVTLLGVEQSVFRRAGFIRQSDMPVTQDEALRRRLNDLVTTGDETGDGDRLAKELKELKNKCRYNRTGLLPQAEAEEDRLEEKIAEWDSLESQSRKELRGTQEDSFHPRSCSLPLPLPFSSSTKPKAWEL